MDRDIYERGFQLLHKNTDEFLVRFVLETVSFFQINGDQN